MVQNSWSLACGLREISDLGSEGAWVPGNLSHCHRWPLLIGQPFLVSPSVQRWVGRASLESSSLHQALSPVLKMVRGQLQGGPRLGLGVQQGKVFG